MYIPHDSDTALCPIPGGLFYSHDRAIQHLEEKLSQFPAQLKEVQDRGLDCMFTGDYLGHQYFQMMMAL